MHNLLGRQTAHTSGITRSFQVDTHAWLTELATEGICKIRAVVQCALQLILCSYDLKLYLYICLQFC